MNKLGWNPYYNEFSKTRGLQAKNDSAIFTLLPTSYGTALRLTDSYTGLLIKEIACMDQDQALSLAETLNYKLSLGHSLRDLIP